MVAKNLPHVTTDPSLLMAAKANSVFATETTPFVKLDAASTGADKLPPRLGEPHATTDPSDLRAAKAKLFEVIVTTPLVSSPDTSSGWYVRPPTVPAPGTQGWELVHRI